MVRQVGQQHRVSRPVPEENLIELPAARRCAAKEAVEYLGSLAAGRVAKVMPGRGPPAAEYRVFVVLQSARVMRWTPEELVRLTTRPVCRGYAAVNRQRVRPGEPQCYNPKYNQRAKNPMKVPAIPAVAIGLIALSLPACERMHASEKEQPHEEQNRIVATSPELKDVTITQSYVCQIRSQKHIEVCPLQEGYLETIDIKEGQSVKKGQELFKILPVLYKAKLEAEQAKADVARIKYEQSLSLFNQKLVSSVDVALARAEMNEAQARANQAKAEVGFTVIEAKFDGIVDRLLKQEGSFVDKKDVLTTLSDNSVMWVYFNVPELRYLEYRAREGKSHNVSQLKLVDSRIDLILADGSKFDQPGGNTVTIEGDVNFETGNFKLRADFPNPDRLLRHGQTGTVLIHRAVHNAVVIPQRATFEILDKRYVWVIGEDHVAHQRPITIQHELEDVFVIQSGLDVKDKIVLEGVQQVHDGEKLEYEFRKPEEALTHQKYHAE